MAKKYFLWMEQGGGCDYTIGCGQVLVPLNVKSDSKDALKKAVLRKIKGEDLQDAMVVSFVLDAMPLYRKQEVKWQKEQERADREAKLAELERLKKELGVD
jgi:hypothetical protein